MSLLLGSGAKSDTDHYVLAYGTPESEAERVPGDLPAPILSSKEMTMRSVLLTRYAPLLAAALMVAYLPSAGARRHRPVGRPDAGPHHRRGDPLHQPRDRGLEGRPGGPATRKQQIKVLTAALKLMHKDYVKDHFRRSRPGPMDVFDYGIGALWRRASTGPAPRWR